jgi:hypothetical protein
MKYAVQMPMDPLAELRDIHLPPPPPLWPPAPGWWIVAMLGVAAVILGARYALTAWRRGRGRRAAARALAQLRSRYQSGEAPGVLTAELATIVRRAAMSRHPRHQVAGLTGRKWLEFLDDGSHQFTEGVGRCLASAPYARNEGVDLDALLTLCEAWVRRNL